MKHRDGIEAATYVRVSERKRRSGGVQPQFNLPDGTRATKQCFTCRNETAVAMVFQNGGHWCVNAICATPQTWAGQKAVEARRIA